jgi:2-polyprenyl-6-methoxyphenol hydroxylase-like FAD-dependent oxidoreductase
MQFCKKLIMKETIHIIGAGIGGLTTALTLKQKGYKIHLYESAAAIKPVGAGIVLASNAMQVFQKLGLQGALENAGHQIHQMCLTDEQINPLSIADLTYFEQKYKVTTLAIHRADLQRILAETIGFEHITFEKRLATLVKKDEIYQLSFQDGTTMDAKIVIGADGIHSKVRNQLLGETRLRNAEQPCWRGVCDLILPEKYQHKGHEAWGRGKRFGFFQINPQKVYWFALINQPKAMPTKVDLLELFKDFHPDILNIISKTLDNQIIMNNIIDLKPIHHWQKGNVCLVGDAAHATTPNLGQGACQAIEDAYTLGKCLENTDDIQIAFQQYEKKRMKKAHLVVNVSWQMGILAHLENRLGVWVRNKMLQYAPKSTNFKLMEQLAQLDE